MGVVVLINFGVKNQVLQVFFKLDAGDLMFVSSYEFADIIFCESLVNYKAISDYGSQAFTLIDLELLRNSYMTERTNTQSFEEGEMCAYTISVENLDLFHNIGSDMK